MAAINQCNALLFVYRHRDGLDAAAHISDAHRNPSAHGYCDLAACHIPSRRAAAARGAIAAGGSAAWQATSAKASHYLLYALLIAMPLVGWSMLSAGGYPIVLGGPIHLPKIVPHNDLLYAFLRSPHDSRISVFRDHPSPCRGRATR
jgi:hypothetical protein